MSATKDTDGCVFQAFESQDGEPLSLPALVDTEKGNLFILWSDIQDAFKSIDHLANRGQRVLFMVDKNDAVQHPLRIERSWHRYAVVHNNLLGTPTEGFSHTLSLNENSPSIDASSASHQKQTSGHNIAVKALSLPLEILFKTYMDVHMHTVSNTPVSRRAFRQGRANARYYHEMIVQELERLSAAGTTALVDGMDKEQLLDQLRERELQWAEWDYQNLFFFAMHVVGIRWEYPMPRLFIVLPQDLNSWGDSDPSTHKLRLYFLCDCSKNITFIPKHVHISNHPGYNLKRQHGFLQTYGDYILRMLQIVKHGYTYDSYSVPPLDTFKILWSCDTDTMGDRLSRDTIIPLVNKAIAYLQELSPPKWLDPNMTRSQSSVIKAYLDVQEGDNAQGNLHRLVDDYHNVYWMCQAHAHPLLEDDTLERLKEFVLEQGGTVDMQQAKVTVELRSTVQADQFHTLLAGFRHGLNISIKLGWKATRSEVKKLFWDLAKTETFVLALDKISVDVHPQNCIQYMTNFMVDEFPRRTKLKLVTILNYPRSRGHCLYMSKFSLRLSSSPEQYSYSWVDLREELMSFGNTLSKSNVVTEWKTAAQVLRSALVKYGLSEVTRISIYNKGLWDGVFDLESASFVEVCSSDMQLPNGGLSFGPLRSLTQHLSDAENDEELYDLLQASTGLQELNISTGGRTILHQAEHIIRLWRNSQNPLRLTLIDRTQDERGRIVAQATISELDRNSARIEAQEGEQAVQAEANLLEWRFHLSDDSASFLEMTTQQHASVLTLLTLNISRLSLVGLACIQRILWQSRLEFLDVMCTSFDLMLSSSIAQILFSVNWSTLKSLMLAGDHIEEWIQLWVTYQKLSSRTFQLSPQLLCVHIRGSGSAPQLLSHSSVLFIHKLIHSSPLTEIYLQNVLFQDKRDWRLIIESVDPFFLETFSLCPCSTAQLTDSGEAWALFQSKFEVDK